MKAIFNGMYYHYHTLISKTSPTPEEMTVPVPRHCNYHNQEEEISLCQIRDNEAFEIKMKEIQEEKPIIQILRFIFFY